MEELEMLKEQLKAMAETTEKLINVITELTERIEALEAKIK